MDRRTRSSRREILGRRHSPTLAQFAASNVLLAFDYDGTLSAIAPSPARARMRRRTRRLLGRVAERYPCVVISGRPLPDLAKRLDGLPLWHIFGNHGLEPWDRHQRYADRVREWARSLARDLPRHQGLVVENKTYSLTIHYRNVRDKQPMLGTVANAVRGLRGVRALGGTLAVNLIPEGAPNKGIALERARRLFGCETAIYAGDDAADEDAFSAAPAERLLSIRIGIQGDSLAGYRLRSQADMDRLLERLLALRAPLARARKQD